MMDLGPAGDLWLVRHTETDWNEGRRYQGRSDRPLTARGADHLSAVAERFRGARIALVISSGVLRTDHLAVAIASETGACRVIRDPRWREIDHGTWEGLTYAEVVAQHGESSSARFEDPWHWNGHGGETLAAVAQRVEAAWEDLRHVPEGGGRIIVSHATPLQLLLCQLLHIPAHRYWQIQVDLGGITHLQTRPSGAVARFVNDVPSVKVRQEECACATPSRRSNP